MKFTIFTNILEYIKGNLEGWTDLFIYWVKLSHLAQEVTLPKIEHHHCQNPAETSVAGSTQVNLTCRLPPNPLPHPTKLPYQLPSST